MAKQLPDPVIVIPGITATYLEDRYPVAPELIWTVLTKDFERAVLHPDDPGLRYELREPARVTPGQVYEVAYKELIEELRFNLTPRADQPVPVYAFGYDWRLPLDLIERNLGEFVGEVIDRTKLLRHYNDAGYGDDPAVTLIGHSMGGLIIAGYLDGAGKQARVRKVVSMAAPFRGSVEAIVKIATGVANIGEDAGSSRERESARLTPALYHLLPKFKGAVTDPAGVEFDIFRPETWQPSIVDTLADYIRQHGLDPKAPREKAQTLFAKLLGMGAAHRNRLEEFKLMETKLKPDDWLSIVGIGARTRVGIKVEPMGRGRQTFAVNSDLRVDAPSNEAGVVDRERTGDGTVPYRGAMSGFIPLEKVVCVTPDDFGFLELQDKALAAASGFHGILPNMNMLIRLIVRYLTGAPDPHGNTWGRRAPGLPANAVWKPPLVLTEKR